MNKTHLFFIKEKNCIMYKTFMIFFYFIINYSNILAGLIRFLLLIYVIHVYLTNFKIYFFKS